MDYELWADKQISDAKELYDCGDFDIDEFMEARFSAERTLLKQLCSQHKFSFRINKKQRWALLIGLVIMCVMFLYPPWSVTYSGADRDISKRPIRYAFVADISYGNVLSHLNIFGRDIEDKGQRIRLTFGYNIDLIRLFIQETGVSVGMLFLLVLFHKNNQRKE